MSFSKSTIGGKAYTLFKLKKEFNVPEFYSINSKLIEKIFLENNIRNADIDNLFNGTIKDRELFREKISKCNILIDLSFLKYLGRELIIRSSAIGEDGSQYSFAGIYSSIKCQNNENEVITEIKKLLISSFSERVFLYSKNIGLKEFPKISFFVQNYIDSEFGGVAFTTSYKNGNKGVLMNVVNGSIENAVLGKNVTTVFIDQNTKGIDIEGRIRIPKTILIGVVEILGKLEKNIGKPQDVEWGYADKKVYILQSRDISKSVDQNIKIYDNSNITESYSGIVLPLTCSFVKMIYAQVYRDVARTSNISTKKINENHEIFDHLISFFYGRIYYDMLEWYKMLTLFPGYNRNRRNLDQMISIRSKAELDSMYHKNVHFTDKISYYMHISFRILRFEKDLKNFKIHVNSYLNKVKLRSFDDMSLDELWKQFKDYEKQLICKWSITVDNDFLAMTWFGLYKKFAQKIGLDDAKMINNISSMHSLISAEQVNVLGSLAHKFRKDTTLMRFAKEEKWKECHNELMNKKDLKDDIEQYLDTYGGRFANELKLESKDLESDQYHIIQLLYSYKDWAEKKKDTNHEPKSHTLGSIILNFLASKTKHYLRHREESRLLRSQAFSYTRKLFIAIGKKLEQKRIMLKYDDIFYLELNEIELLIKGKDIDAKIIIEKRRKEYALYENIDLENIIITKNNELPEPIIRNNSFNSKILQGVGCSPGKIVGKVTVMKVFKIPKKPLDIVVVKHTDPGWTPLFGLCNGLIVENGGLLSHAAIISRELNLPCIINVKNATNILKNGQIVKLNGYTGSISIE